MPNMHQAKHPGQLKERPGQSGLVHIDPDLLDLHSLLVLTSLLSFQGSFFCSQTCFKGSWDLHKALHKLAKGPVASQNSKRGGGGGASYNPWPGYLFTGRLRPAEQSPRRVVPDHIPRPDYAEHPEGHPLSEMKLKGNTYVRSLDDEEVMALRATNA